MDPQATTIDPVSSRTRKTFVKGALIARRYVVVSCLGRGAAGTVYLCNDKNEPQVLKAIKVLLPFDEDSIVFDRFYREGKVAQRIKSSYVVKSYDLVVDDGVFAFTMEYVKGKTLEQLLRPIPCPALTFVVRALWEIAQGLMAIHKEGLVHRDLKPSNVLVSEDTHFKIADFGVVHKVNGLALEITRGSILTPGKKVFKGQNWAQVSKLTGQNQIVGTIDYVSPEYVKDSIVDIRSDIYALGTLAYEMLTGSVPFPKGDQFLRLSQRVLNPAPEISSVRNSIPQGLSDLVMQCLEREPTARPQSAEEFISKLESAIGGSGLFCKAPQGRVIREQKPLVEPW